MSCCGCTASRKANAARWRRGACPGADSPTGATGKEARIVYVTPGYRMIALEAKTGERVREFGSGGVVDLKQGMDQTIDPLSPEIGLHATPIIARNVVIVGAAHKSGGVPTGKSNVKGYVRGFDVRTGKRLWIFRTIPQPGEFGADTWLEGSATYTGNTGVWTQISVDEQLGLVYLPVESTTGDYYGGHRPGANLLADSLVAVDLRTGVRKWHFQFVHHGIWDMDLACAPILADIAVGGRPIKAVAVPTKQAFLYVFNRETGEPMWPIEERPVEKGDVPREWYSPTQPFPTRPPAYDRQGLAHRGPDRLHSRVARRGRATRVALQDWSGLHAAGREQTRWTAGYAGDGDGRRRHQLAGRLVRSETDILYVSSSKIVSQLGLVPPRSAEERHVLRAGQCRDRCAARRLVLALDRLQDPEPQPRLAAKAAVAAGSPFRGLPLVKPPYGQISAIDLNKGEILWQVAHGETPAVVRNHPDLKGLHDPAHRSPRNRRDAGHQDAADRGRGRLRSDAIGAARRDAARLRQGHGPRSGRGLHTRTARRVADDLSLEGPPVSRHRRQRRGLCRRVDRVPSVAMTVVYQPEIRIRVRIASLIQFWILRVSRRLLLLWRRQSRPPSLTFAANRCPLAPVRLVSTKMPPPESPEQT